ncbi:hypothetical protein RE628_11565 [Paenibacillus sp. D2_2]|uniref:hypothetical protein n=1 Tax=Paenibacillus sp. D2_2 TaxID=3073092 RepID=UPI002815372A|nr:hypothetical protein [Paenibacillus sp. D2_2]WMT42863.1 hypothetical protein RE628_11565 [Paenibacillus sp. D2_2]
MLNLNEKSKELLAIVCETTNKESVEEFNRIFMKIRNYIPTHLIDEFDKLEEIYNDNSLPLITAYKIGYYDGSYSEKEKDEASYYTRSILGTNWGKNKSA